MKGVLLALILFAALIVAMHKDPGSLIGFRGGYRPQDGLIVSTYRQTVERVKEVVSNGIQFTHESWVWARGIVD